MTVTLVVVGTNSDAFHTFSHIRQGVDIRLVVNDSRRALAAIGNEQLLTSAEVFGLVHADTVFRTGALEAFCAEATKGHVCGIVGRSVGGEYRWCHNNPGEVCTLDSCGVFFPTLSGLRFDANRFDSFHCYVEDLCMQARQIGMKVTVPHAAASHVPNFPSSEWSAQYAFYRNRLVQKWAGFQLWTT